MTFYTGSMIIAARNQFLLMNGIKLNVMDLLDATVLLREPWSEVIYNIHSTTLYTPSSRWASLASCLFSRIYRNPATFQISEGSGT